MPDARDCPTRQDLADFVVGRTTEDRARDVETHLIGCPRCESVLAAINQPDPLVNAVRAGVEDASNPADNSLIDRLQRMAPSPDSAGLSTDPNMSVATGTFNDVQLEVDRTEPGYDFLAPPHDASEIGWLGPYRVLGVLGRGGMGVVFRAEDPKLGRPVALKAMLPKAATAETATSRFMAEARAAAQLKHDHVVTIYHVDEDRGVPFIAMELLDGESLEDRLQRVGRQTTPEVLRVGRETAAALAAAHARGMVHRDIKPGNLWLEAPSGRIKVLDFGLARATVGDANLTSTGVIVGTPACMAPEQARAQKVDGRADLFALGCVLYRACTGRQPFTGPDVMAVLVAVVADIPPSPRDVCPDVPAGLSALVMKLLEKNPDRRPQSGEELVRDLAALELETVTVPVRERPRPRRLIAAGLLLAAFAAALAGWVIIRDKDGNEVARVKVPDGGSATVIPDAQKPERPLTPVSKISPPASIAEPPPLAEWLKGRTVLTVSQDGKGQFKTIQAALNALKKGQVVRVLDKGPYRESLRMDSMPEDIGLVSDQQTVIELADWAAIPPAVEAGFPATLSYGHRFIRVRGFRVSGFAWRHDVIPSSSAAMLFLSPGRLVIEDCAVTGPKDLDARVLGVQIHGGSADPLQPVVVRDCRFHAAELNVIAHIGVPWPATSTLVERNLCHATGKNSGIFLNGPHREVIVRHNVVVAVAPAEGITVGGVEPYDTLEVLEIRNNTVTDSAVNKFEIAAPRDNVVIRNNILPAFRLTRGAEREVTGEAVRRQWRVSNNCYSIAPDRGPLRPMSVYDPATDLTVRPEFLSLDPGNREYLRIPAAGLLATGGAGGAWPAYVGALPPGPAPKDGDWFTLLRDRWGDVTPRTVSPPAKLPEPPPLAEWLKGRTELTVSQDGKGQFKTIQAALEALQPGQVVRVLDKGPYRERLDVQPLPKDTGLISEKQTVLIAPEWKPVYKEFIPASGGEVDIFAAHVLNRANGFRLHGFELQFPKSAGKLARRLLLGQARSVVLENCWIHASESLEGEPVDIGDWDDGDGLGLTAYVRDCVFEGSLGVSGHHKRTPIDPTRLSSAVVERNYFIGTGTDHHLVCVGQGMTNLVIRNNVFAGKSIHDILLDRIGLPEGVMEVSNNSLGSTAGIAVVKSLPKGNVTIRNNLLSREGVFVRLIGFADKVNPQDISRWNMDHNSYPDPPGGSINQYMLSRPKGDISTMPRFLSKIPQERDFLRIVANDPLATAGAGGVWPNYLGALPPGPAPKEGDWFTRLRDRWPDQIPMKP